MAYEKCGNRPVDSWLSYLSEWRCPTFLNQDKKYCCYIYKQKLYRCCTEYEKHEEELKEREEIRKEEQEKNRKEEQRIREEQEKKRNEEERSRLFVKSL